MDFCLKYLSQSLDKMLIISKLQRYAEREGLRSLLTTHYKSTTYLGYENGISELHTSIQFS